MLKGFSLMSDVDNLVDAVFILSFMLMLLTAITAAKATYAVLDWVT